LAPGGKKQKKEKKSEKYVCKAKGGPKKEIYEPHKWRKNDRKKGQRKKNETQNYEQQQGIKEGGGKGREWNFTGVGGGVRRGRGE